jgi:hypothetical protein
MKILSPKNHLHDDDFSPGAFFGLSAVIALLVAGVATVSLDQLGARTFLLDHRLAVWLASLLIGLCSSSVIFDHQKR